MRHRACRVGLFVIWLSLQLVAGDRVRIGWTGTPAAGGGAQSPSTAFVAHTIAEAARRADVDLLWVHTRNALDVDRKLDGREIDLYPAAVSTAQRRGRFWLSEAWWSEDLSLLTRKGAPASREPFSNGHLALASPLLAETARRAYPQAAVLDLGSDASTVIPAAVAVCRATAEAALMPSRVAAAVVLDDRPQACASTAFAIVDLPVGVDMALMTRPGDAAIGERLRASIENMALDGTLARLAAAHPGISISSALGIAERSRLRAERRWIWSVAGGLVCAAALLLLYAWRTRSLKGDLCLAENQYRYLFESMNDAFMCGDVIVDEDGRGVDWRYVDANPAYTRMLAESGLGDWRGRTHSELVPPERRSPGWCEVLCRVGLSGNPEVFTEVSIATGRHLKGSIYSPVPGRFAVVFVDETDRILAEQELARSRQELEDSNRALDRSNTDLQAFAYTIAHDLQEPARMVSTFTELFMRRHGAEVSEAARELLAITRQGALRMSSMLKDLLSFSRAGQDVRPPVPVESGYALCLAMQGLSVKIAETGAEIVRGRLPRVRAWDGRLEQVFQNLVENAIKYRRPGVNPRVEVDAVPVDGMWQFSVTDNGVGFDMRYAEKVFDVFHRLGPRSEATGNGIGLAIVRRLVERHGGRVWVDWSEPGKGTRFCFTMPSAAQVTIAAA